MLVRKVFKKQMKQFAVEMLEDYAKYTDNDVDDQLVARVKGNEIGSSLKVAQDINKNRQKILLRT